ncbi:class I SAM-dependent methyltransferase [Bacillus sp. FJAT-28004]|uniref:class I SAM-dependent methyltransferase n=1 Tax=Bacillus sp. FJAT-28004 TaxID=1679165 RepID=UPI0006B5C8CC|nr:class I SAM-dependent methyltransferase [Bacillus sp. FJAT-28004]
MYQDIWIKGRLTNKGLRDCANRYKHIKSYLKKLDQPFTVLDIGANAGYFSYRIAEDFNAKVTMIEANDFIHDIMEKNNNKNVTLIQRLMNANDLKQLANNQHYDVVLALSIVHHFQEYREAIDTIFKLGRIIFIEPPAIEETSNKLRGHRTKGIHQMLQLKSPQILTYTKLEETIQRPLRPLMVFDRP